MIGQVNARMNAVPYARRLKILGERSGCENVIDLSRRFSVVVEADVNFIGKIGKTERRAEEFGDS